MPSFEIWIRLRATIGSAMRPDFGLKRRAFSRCSDDICWRFNDAREARRPASHQIGGVCSPEIERDRRGLCHGWRYFGAGDLRLRHVPCCDADSAACGNASDGIGIGAVFLISPSFTPFCCVPLPVPATGIALWQFYSQDAVWSHNTWLPGRISTIGKNASHGSDQMAILRWTGFTFGTTDGFPSSSTLATVRGICSPLWSPSQCWTFLHPG